MRRVNFQCEHFIYTVLPNYNPMIIQELRHWINANLKYRFYIGRELAVDIKNNFVYNTKIGFETEQDIFLFNLSCPFI